MLRAGRAGLNQLGKALRETGQALDRVGLQALGSDVHKELWSRHRPVMNVFDSRPRVATNAFIAPSASVIGEVEVWDKASVWYGAVIKGDRASVKVGAVTNVQDHVVISTVSSLETGFPPKVDIGHWVTIGHGASLVSCTIGDKALIGIGAVIGEGALIEEGAQVAAGTVVPAGARIPAGELWAGNPAKFVKKLDGDDVQQHKELAESYHHLAMEHDDEFQPYGTAYLQAEELKTNFEAQQSKAKKE